MSITYWVDRRGGEDGERGKTHQGEEKVLVYPMKLTGPSLSYRDTHTPQVLSSHTYRKHSSIRTFLSVTTRNRWIRRQVEPAPEPSSDMLAARLTHTTPTQADCHDFSGTLPLSPAPREPCLPRTDAGPGTLHRPRSLALMGSPGGSHVPKRQRRTVSGPAS